MKSQKQRIIKHLKSHTGLTSLTAFERYGITRLSGRIFDLRQDGYNITSIPKEVKNRYGETCHVTEYRLVK